MARFCVGLVLLFLGLARAWTPIKMTLDFDAYDISPCNGVTGGQSVCDVTCTKVGFCLNNEFKETIKCDKFCKPGANGQASCGDDPGTCIPNSNVTGCDATGTFPDLYDCQNTITCVKGSTGTRVRKCPSNAYDPCRGECDLPLSSPLCNPVPPLCEGPGHVLPVPNNHRLYYYCAEDANHRLHPVIGKCEKGFFENGGCGTDGQIGCLPVNDAGQCNANCQSCSCCNSVTDPPIPTTPH